MKPIEIKIPVSPSKRISDTIIELIKIKTTWGGGVGGASKTEYVSELVDENDLFFKAIYEDGHVKRISKRYVVEYENVRVVEVAFDTTEHTNYITQKVNKSILTQRFELKSNQDYILTDARSDVDNPQLISSKIYSE